MPSRERIRELMPVLQAFAEGKTIQWRIEDGEWNDHTIRSCASGLSFLDRYEYRVKPEPVKYEKWVNTYFDKVEKEFKITHYSLYNTKEEAQQGAEKTAGAVLVYLGPMKLEYTEEL